MELSIIETRTQHLTVASKIRNQVNPSMSSTSLREARADINAEINKIEKDRTAFKRELLAEYERRFAEAYHVDEVKELHAEVKAMFDEAKKREDTEELNRIESIIIEANADQVDRKKLSSAKAFKGKSENYIISHIETEIDDIIFSVEEEEVAQPQSTPAKDFKVTLSFTTTDKQLAREVTNMCRKAGVRVATRKD